MNNRIICSGNTLFKKDEAKDCKLVLLLEGHLVAEDGKEYKLKTPSFVNETAYFNDS